MLSRRFLLVALAIIVVESGCSLFGKNPNGPSSTINVDVQILNLDREFAITVNFRGGSVRVDAADSPVPDPEVITIEGVRKNDTLVFTAKNLTQDPAKQFTVQAFCNVTGRANLKPTEVAFVGNRQPLCVNF